MEDLAKSVIPSSEKDALSERMQSLASALVRVAWERFQLRLDYSDGSVAQVEDTLDKLQRDLAGKGPEAEARIGVLSRYFGAYLGEVVRRKHEGTWQAEVPNAISATVGVEAQELIFAPLRGTYLRLSRGSAFNVALLCQKFDEAVSQNRAAHDEPGTEVKQVRELVRSYATQAVQDAKNRFDLELDYTEASLDLLERIVSLIGNLLTDCVPVSQRLRNDEKMLLKAQGALCYGAHLGEMICKSLGGDWQATIPGTENRRIVVVIGGQWFDPLEFMRVAIKGSEDMSVKSFYLDAKKTTQFDGVITHRKC